MALLAKEGAAGAPGNIQMLHKPSFVAFVLCLCRLRSAVSDLIESIALGHRRTRAVLRIQAENGDGKIIASERRVILGISCQLVPNACVIQANKARVVPGRLDLL